MLSKCLNPRCTASFRYLGQGRLFRIDFSEVARRKNALAGRELTTVSERPVEHFWLCESCAPSMTIQLSEAGEVRLISFETAAKQSAARVQDYNLVGFAS
jgi:hypothetical protein